MEPLGADLFLYRKPAEAGLAGVDTNKLYIDGGCESRGDDDSDTDETLDQVPQSVDDDGEISDNHSSVVVSASELNDDSDVGNTLACTY